MIDPVQFQAMPVQPVPVTGAPPAGSADDFAALVFGTGDALQPDGTDPVATGSLAGVLSGETFPAALSAPFPARVTGMLDVPEYRAVVSPDLSSDAFLRAQRPVDGQAEIDPDMADSAAPHRSVTLPDVAASQGATAGSVVIRPDTPFPSLVEAAVATAPLLARPVAAPVAGALTGVGPADALADIVPVVASGSHPARRADDPPRGQPEVDPATAVSAVPQMSTALQDTPVVQDGAAVADEVPVPDSAVAGPIRNASGGIALGPESPAAGPVRKMTPPLNPDAVPAVPRAAMAEGASLPEGAATFPEPERDLAGAVSVHGEPDTDPAPPRLPQPTDAAGAASPEPPARPVMQASRSDAGLTTADASMSPTYVPTSGTSATETMPDQRQASPVTDGETKRAAPAPQGAAPPAIPPDTIQHMVPSSGPTAGTGASLQEVKPSIREMATRSTTDKGHQSAPAPAEAGPAPVGPRDTQAAAQPTLAPPMTVTTDVPAFALSNPMMPSSTPLSAISETVLPDRTAPLRPEQTVPVDALPALLLSHTDSGAAEIHLEPVELGRLRLDVVANGQEVQVTLAAERSDTADFLRRFATELAAEFRQAGFVQVTVGFGAWGDGRGDQRPQPMPQGPQSSQPNDPQVPAAQAVAALVLPSRLPARGLNLRL